MPRSLLADARARVVKAQATAPELMPAAQVARVLATMPNVAARYVSPSQIRKERRGGGVYTVGQLSKGAI